MASLLLKKGILIPTFLIDERGRKTCHNNKGKILTLPFSQQIKFSTEYARDVRQKHTIEVLWA